MKFIIITFSTLIVSYLFVLNNQFIGDDDIRILRNYELASFSKSLTGDLGDRPLLMLLTWIQYTIFGLKPIFFRITNLVIHTFAAFQFYKLILDLNKNVEFEYKKSCAYFAAFLFAIHPLHNQTMNIAIQSSIPIGACLGILSFRYLLKYLENEKSNFLIFSNLSLAMALLAKPNVIFFPIVFFITWFIIYREKKKSCFFIFSYLSVLIIPIFFYFFLKKNPQQDAASPIVYFLTQTEVLFTYYRLILLPVNLKYLYDFYPPIDIFLNINWIYFLIHVAGFTLIYIKLKSKIQKISIICFFISFLPESSFFPINHFAFEHRTYYPLLFVFLFIAQYCIDKKIQINKIKNVFFTIIPIYLILNQARNFQIKPMHNWLLHSVENSISHHVFNLSFTPLLIESRLYTEELVPIINKYKEMYSHIPDYKILILAHEYQVEPRFDKLLHLAKFIFLNLRIDTRLWLNNFLLDSIASEKYQSQKTKNIIIIESVLSNQMKVFFENKEQFQLLIDYYKELSNKILLDISAYKKEVDNIEILRIKSILYHYYGHDFNGLQNEINAELLKEQDSPVLKRLLELTQSRLK